MIGSRKKMEDRRSRIASQSAPPCRSALAILYPLSSILYPFSVQFPLLPDRRFARADVAVDQVGELGQVEIYFGNHTDDVQLVDVAQLGRLGIGCHDHGGQTL